MAHNSGNASIGLLKFIHMTLGAVALGIVSYYSSIYGQKTGVMVNELFYFHLVTFAFLVTSFLLGVTNEYDEGIENSYFEIIYHLFGFIFYFSASFALIAYLMGWNDDDIQKLTAFKLHKVAAIVGILNSFAYLANAMLSIYSHISRSRADPARGQ